MKKQPQLKTVWVSRRDIECHDLRRNSNQYTLTEQELDWLNPDNIVEFPVESVSPRGTHVTIRTVEGFGPEHTLKLHMGNPVELFIGCAFASYYDALRYMLLRAIDACDNLSLASAAGKRYVFESGSVLNEGHEPDVEDLRMWMRINLSYYQQVANIIDYVEREQNRRQHDKG